MESGLKVPKIKKVAEKGLYGAFSVILEGVKRIEMKHNNNIILQDPPGRDFSVEFSSVKKIEKYLDSPILDIGCKAGKLVYKLIDKGYDAYGMDIGPRAAQQWTKHREKFYEGDIEEYIPFDINFKLIVMSHVLEHLYNPQETLTRLRGRLKNGGKIFIEVPIGDMRHISHKIIFKDLKEVEEMARNGGYKVDESSQRRVDNCSIAYLWLSL